MNKQVLITKASGEQEIFSSDKLRKSLQRVGTDSNTVEGIIKHIEGELKPGMKTSKIYQHAFSLLKKKEKHTAARYSLKKAIRDLGPSGHPFEKFVGALLTEEGYSNVEVAVILQGLCISHEVDVVAELDDPPSHKATAERSKKIIAECKFHNYPGIKSDTKTALYVQARFEDIVKAFKNKGENVSQKYEAWLVTNTKLTKDATDYANCIGMKVIGWSYPNGNGLESRIDKSGIHPITCLTSLSAYQKRFLAEEGIVLCRELKNNINVLKKLGLKQNKINKVIGEANHLCS